MQLQEALSLFSQEAGRLEKAQEQLKTEIAQLKDNLKSSNETLETLFSSLADALIYINQEGIVEWVNESFLDLFDRTRSDLVKKPYLSSFEDTFFGFPLTKGLSEKKISRRLFLTHKIGKHDRELEVIATSVQSKKGGMLLMIKRAEAALRLEMASEKHREWRELHEMMGSLAHEIRNPLSGIQGFATLLLRELKDENFHDMLSSILDGTKMISRLVDDALTSTSAPVINLVYCDLIALIEETLLFAEVSLDIRDRFSFQRDVGHNPSLSSEGLSQDKKNVEKSLTVEESPHCQGGVLHKKREKLFLFIDRELFKRALFNILKNGHEASPHLLPVILSLKTDENNVWIDIKDQGRGIESALLKKLFTVNFSTKKGGHGFGLFESYKAIAALGGTIQVESKINEGSTFTIKLPLNHATGKNSDC